MNPRKILIYFILQILIILFITNADFAKQEDKTMISDALKQDVIAKLVQQHGDHFKDRIEKGVGQVASFWTSKDGTAEDFTRFCISNFLADNNKLLETFNRIEYNFEIIFGNYLQITRELTSPVQLDLGSPLPVDYMFAEFSPDTHFYDDLFTTKVAFVVLLNFPLYSLQEKMALAPQWSRLDWGKARLADLFLSRIPYEAQQQALTAYLRAEDYISNYNIFMHNIIMNNKKDLFPQGLTLISHWGLRDELKAHYSQQDHQTHQEAIFSIMEHIINQDIPLCVINSDKVIWDVINNKTYALDTNAEMPCEPEKDKRYQYFLNIYKAEKNQDAYYPNLPTLIARRFDKMREIPEAKVLELFDSLMKSPVIPKVGKAIEKRLKRKLRPYDIWYTGFKPVSNYSETELDSLVKEKYPSVQAFQKDIPNILTKLGFDKEIAHFISSKIVVDPARGSGHAMGARMKDDNAHLRTRIPSTGMTYKGYNIAIHELGHNVEQVLSLHKVDHYFLMGVPNTAFTEAYAFVFQSRDQELLGLKKSSELDKYWFSLHTIWATYEIAGVSMVDIEVWHWLYDHPNADASQLKDAVIKIAKDVWNRYYAPVFKVKDQDILAIYSHMIELGMYLPDYCLGHLISFQLEQYMEQQGSLAGEMQRQCSTGSIVPQEWMKTAVGKPISATPMISAAEEALKKLKLAN